MKKLFLVLIAIIGFAFAVENANSQCSETGCGAWQTLVVSNGNSSSTIDHMVNWGIPNGLGMCLFDVHFKYRECSPPNQKYQIYISKIVPLGSTCSGANEGEMIEAAIEQMLVEAAAIFGISSATEMDVEILIPLCMDWNVGNTEYVACGTDCCATEYEISWPPPVNDLTDTLTTDTECGIAEGDCDFQCDHNNLPTGELHYYAPCQDDDPCPLEDWSKAPSSNGGSQIVPFEVVSSDETYDAEAYLIWKKCLLIDNEQPKSSLIFSIEKIEYDDAITQPICTIMKEAVEEALQENVWKLFGHDSKSDLPDPPDYLICRLVIPSCWEKVTGADDKDYLFPCFDDDCCVVDYHIAYDEDSLKVDLLSATVVSGASSSCDISCTNVCSCLDDVSIKIGIREKELNGNMKYNFNVIPNPTTGETTISLNGAGNGKIEISISDINGGIVYQNTNNKNSTYFSFDFDTRSWTSGTYLYQIKLNEINIIQSKFVVTK